VSDVDLSRLRSVTARDLTRALLKDGFVLERQKGSHRQYSHPNGRRVTLTFHSPGDTFPLKLLSSMIEKQAKWTEADLKRVGLLS